MGRNRLVMVIDDNVESRAQVEALLQQAPVAIVADSGYGPEAQTLAAEVRPEVVLASIEAPAEAAIATLKAVREVLPEAQIVAYSGIVDMQVARQVMQIGVSDFLPLPLEAAELASAIEGLPVVAVARGAAVAEAVPVPEVHEGKVLTVFGAKGGIGKSTISTNLATLLAQNNNYSVLLIDMDTRFGDIAIMMDVEPESTVADLAGRMDEMDEATYREALLLHETGVHILSAPKHPSEWRNITADQMKELIQYGATLFDYVVLDTPGTFNDLVATAIEVAHQVMVISSLDLASIKDTAYMLDLLEAEGYPSERLLLTINDVNAVNTIRVDDLPQIVHHDIYWQIPYDDQVIRAGQSGQPVVVVKPKSRAAKEMRALAEKLVGAPMKSAQTSQPRRGRRILSWFLRPVPGLRAASIS